MTDQKLNHDELRKLAEAATQGYWHAPGLGEIHVMKNPPDGPCTEIAGIIFQYEEPDGEIIDGGTEEDATFIAAANPQKVIDLLHEIKALQAQVDLLRSGLLWVLYRHQGGKSDIGQPIRRALGIGPHDQLSEKQVLAALNFSDNFRKRRHE